MIVSKNECFRVRHSMIEEEEYFVISIDPYPFMKKSTHQTI